MSTHVDLWESGVDAEVKFWDDYISTKGLEWPDDYADRLNPKRELQPWLVKYLPTDNKYIDILDNGSGPLTVLGKIITNSDAVLRITCADPLADHYLQLLKKHEVASLTNLVKAKSEELSRHFAENHFDFVFMRNALDHAFDPLTSVGEMIKVVAPGGYVVLEHENNEAENEGYADLHQWNIKIDNGQFLIWNKSITYNVSEHYNNVATIICSANETHNYIEIQKK